MGLTNKLNETAIVDNWHRAEYLKFGRTVDPKTGQQMMVFIIDGMSFVFSEEAAQATVEGFSQGLGIIRAERN